jgi:serine/threonine-protein kinase
VADGLDYAHARGVVHRDIKPTNILLDGAGGVYIGDFGLAQMLDGDRHVTRTEAIMGTPHYIAPERALGQPADYRCDIYSLGIVAYEMLVGRLPFAADSPVAVLLKHVNEPLPAPPAGLLPRPVEEVLRRAAAKDPADRPLSARAFISSLQAALDMAPADLERLGPAIAPRHSLGGTLAKAGGAVAVFCAAIGLAWCPARNPATGVNLTASLAAEHPAAAAPSTSTDTLGPGRKDTGFPEQKPTDAPERKPSPTSVPPAGVGTPSSGEQPPPYGIEPSGTGLAPEPSEADATLALLNPPSEAPPPDPPSPPPPPDPQLAAPAVEARVADVITEPVLLEKIAPNFPPTAKALQVEGQVVLEVTVGADGTVREVEVLRSSNRVFDNFAKEALLKARYKPGERNGVPESATIEVTVSFKLD